MSLPAPYSEVYLAGDGVTTEFAFGTDFTPISAELVKCSIYLQDGYEIIPTYTVDMTVGSITISALTLPDNTVLTAPPLGSTVRIYRDEPEAQNVTASQLQAFTAKQLERALDAIVAMIQEVSYTTDHKTIRLTEPQRDIALQELGGLEDGHLIYWDNTVRKLVVTNYPQQDVVRCVNGLFFRLRTNPNTNTPYLQWSTDNSDWHSIDVDSAYALANDAYTLADSAYNLASTTRGELNAHKANHANPHETSMANLIDTNISGLQSGQFLQFNGLNWVNVNYNTTVTWGGIYGNITDQADLQTALTTLQNNVNGKVSKSGDKMSGTLAFENYKWLRFNSAYTGVYGYFSMNSAGVLTYSQVYNNGNTTLTYTFSYYNGGIHIIPSVDNKFNLGTTSYRFNTVCTKWLQSNGAACLVPSPAQQDVLATKSDVDLAANSGRMITDQGVWFAKMYAATVVPTGAEYDGKNYADFSQVDADNNPVIKIYTGASGMWTLSETITPPADYDGYVPITSKIWDIAEQSGQQGGRVLWNHQSKEFTPYPTIVSFENAALTGTPTAPLPDADSPNNQIATKEYVDTHVPENPSTFHPDLFDWKWADHQVNDIQWLRADTFSWQSGSVYEAAFDELFYDMQISTYWYGGGGPAYTKSRTPAVGDAVYLNSDLTTQIGTVEAYDDANDEITVSGNTYTFMSNTYVTPTTETVAGYSVSVYTGHSGRKIVSAGDETKVANIYAATGVAWYYIIDIPNKRFKLPRTKFGFTGLRDNVGKYVEPGLPNITATFTSDNRDGSGFHDSPTGAITETVKSASWGFSGGGAYSSSYARSFNASQSSSIYGNDTTVQPPATQMYLYFYVGEFTQTATENTAGLNAELFNDKVDVGHQVIAFQAPNAGNNYTWYRKYADGWVEQGGSNVYVNEISTTTVVLPITMADTDYTAVAQNNSLSTATDTENGVGIEKTSATTVTLFTHYINPNTISVSWEVKGMAA